MVSLGKAELILVNRDQGSQLQRLNNASIQTFQTRFNLNKRSEQ